jgi:hypothetical protein
MFLKSLRRHLKHWRLHVEKREMSGCEPARNGRAEKTGSATDFENAIRR